MKTINKFNNEVFEPKATQFYDNLLENYSSFEQYSNNYNQKFLSDFETCYRNMMKISSNSTDEIQFNETEKSIDKLMNSATNLFKSVHFFIQRAFPHDYRVWDEFGISEYNEARPSTAKMANFLKGIKRSIGNYRSQLDMVHCPKSLPGQLTTLINSLESTTKAREKQRAKMEVVVIERNELQNQLYKMMVKIQQDALKIFDENPDLCAKFLIGARLMAPMN